ncbi:MAG: YncE family protein, partial [Dehalococcoidia bacterium]
MKRANFLLVAVAATLCLGLLASGSVAYAAGAPTVLATISLPGEPRFMGVNQVTHRVYVATGDGFNSATHKVAVIDGMSLLTSIAQPDASTGPIFVTTNDLTNRVYVTHTGAGGAAAINGATNAVIGAMPSGAYPESVVTHPGANRAYIANTNSGTISVINTAGDVNSLVTNIPVPGTGAGITNLYLAIMPTTNRLFVTAAGLNKIFIIDTTTNTVLSSAIVPGGPRQIVADASANRLWVTNGPGIRVLDASTLTTVATVPVGSTDAHGLALNANQKRLYVTNSSSPTLTVIDATTNTVSAAVDLGSNLMFPGTDPTNSRVYVGTTAKTLLVLDDSPAVADLSITQTGPATANMAAEFDYVLTLSNSGPATASGVTVNDALPSTVQFINSPAGCTHDGSLAGGVATCQVASVAPGANIVLGIHVRAIAPGAIPSNASITFFGNVTDTNAANNQAAVTTTISSLTYALTVARQGTGLGTVTSTPAGIDCGSSCTATFDSGAVVTLTATPDATSTFTGWSGACTGTGSCVVTMDAAKSVTATFTKRVYPLTVARVGAGTVTSTPGGIFCGAACSATFDSGTVVTLTATPDATSTFTGWSGACTGTGSCVVTIDAAKTVTATFTTVTYTLTVTRQGTGLGTVTSAPAGI